MGVWSALISVCAELSAGTARTVRAGYLNLRMRGAVDGADMAMGESVP